MKKFDIKILLGRLSLNVGLMIIAGIVIPPIPFAVYVAIHSPTFDLMPFLLNFVASVFLFCITLYGVRNLKRYRYFVPEYFQYRATEIINSCPETNSLLNHLIEGPLDSLRKQVLRIETSGYVSLAKNIANLNNNIAASKEKLPALETKLAEAKSKLGLR